MRHAYTESDRSTDHKGGGKSAAKQEFKDECDVNVIVQRHLQVGGLITPQEFSDELVTLPDNFDYHQALNAVIDAQEAFEKLPSELRTAHNNDPGSILAHLDSAEYRSGQVDAFGSPTQPREEAEEAPRNAPEEPGTVPT